VYVVFVLAIYCEFIYVFIATAASQHSGSTIRDIASNVSPAMRAIGSQNNLQNMPPSSQQQLTSTATAASCGE
jgi:hypothetical protein